MPVSDHSGNGVAVILVVQHHHVDIEYLRVRFADLVDVHVVQLLELTDCGFLCFVEPAYFLRGILDCPLLSVEGRLFQYAHAAGHYCAVNAFPVEYCHRISAPLLIIGLGIPPHFLYGTIISYLWELFK